MGRGKKKKKKGGGGGKKMTKQQIADTRKARETTNRRERHRSKNETKKNKRNKRKDRWKDLAGDGELERFNAQLHPMGVYVKVSGILLFVVLIVGYRTLKATYFALPYNSSSSSVGSFPPFFSHFICRDY